MLPGEPAAITGIRKAASLLLRLIVSMCRPQLWRRAETACSTVARKTAAVRPEARTEA